RKSVPQKAGPCRCKITRGRRGAERFLHELWSLYLWSTQEGVHQLNFRETAKEWEDHRLNRQIRALESERVPPCFQVMSSGDVPIAQLRSCILIMTETHDVGHSLLKIGPIDRAFLSILSNPAGRIVHRITTEDEKLLDPARIDLSR